ncbi:hypothetical protein LSCM1_04692 [Leishmania martiniquensis]|uniref:Uncharacterized protein n=1 Tax=Leishmania martiniquensis TaxID=1580590 RepID=A0A836H8B4_9TRYP|nr:hypothetical protein LSCM1_04692 [Leishmania martiniquensis]
MHPVRRFRPSASWETRLASATHCHRLWHCCAAGCMCARTASAPAAHGAHPCPAGSPCSAGISCSHHCPTAAVLVDAGGSALVTLPYCITDVQEKVRAHLRLLLIQRLVTPLATGSLAEIFGECDSEGGGGTYADRSGDNAALASAFANNVTRSPSTLRYLAFSQERPLLRHPSWAPLWAPSLSSSIRSPAPCASPPKPQATTHAGAKQPDEAVAEALTVEVTRVENEALEALVRPCLGEVAPLLGRNARGSFLAVAVTAMRTTLATGSPSTRAATPSATPLVPSRSLLSSLPVVTYWERCRVDSFVPSYVQVQAAVRHLLSRRRPAAGVTAPAAFAWAPQRPPVRPLALVAVVVPDHLTELYLEFVDMLEREVGQPLHHQHSQQHGAAGGDPVHLLLFNSRGLIRECTTV